MKIDPAAPQRPAKARRLGGAGPAKPGGFAKALAETSTAGAVSGSAPIGTVEAMLAAQEVTDATDRRGRARRRGEDILDRLDEIRLDLLLGAIPLARLQGLARSLHAARTEVEDPRLEAVIDEIELRAAVELAKLSR